MQYIKSCVTRKVNKRRKPTQVILFTACTYVRPSILQYTVVQLTVVIAAHEPWNLYVPFTLIHG